MSPSSPQLYLSREDTGFPAHLPFLPHALSLCKASCSGHCRALSTSAKRFPGAVQFSSSSAGCTLSSALEVGVLQAETHLGAIQEQQVPAFLVKEEKNPNKPAREQSWGSSAVATCVSVHGGNIGVLQSLQNTLLAGKTVSLSHCTLKTKSIPMHPSRVRH